DPPALARGACALTGRGAGGCRCSSGNSSSGARRDGWPVAGQRAEQQLGTKHNGEPGSISSARGGGKRADDRERPSDDDSAPELASCSRRGCARDTAGLSVVLRSELL